eukprot:31147-Pelagococcus_subviridis.AAC.3
MNSPGGFRSEYVKIWRPTSSATIALDSRFIRMDEIVAALARSSSSSVTPPDATASISRAMTAAISLALPASATPETPTTPTSSNTE